MTQALPTLPPAAPPGVGRPRLLLGDEAVAFGALDAGIAAAYAYPGTPSTEILETLIGRADEAGITAHWTANEKTAYEQALGVSMMGRRALVAMKHVGLNVAMDPFVNSALVGIRGGLVLAVADDPGMHSSQNEQDSRVLADFARIPVLEPADQQEAYDMTRLAFQASERFGLPVVVRLVTRLCHGRSAVRTAEPEAGAPCSKPDSPRDWVLLPANARRLWRELLDRQEAVAAWAAELPFTVQRELGPADPGGGPSPAVDPRPRGARMGVITAGIARGYLDENARELTGPVPHLHLGALPPPAALIRRWAEGLDQILILEEGFPHLESRVRALLGSGPRVLGRADGIVPPDGELTPDRVRDALGLPAHPRMEVPADLPARPPQLCQGCPHRDAYAAITRALEGVEASTVTGDIGCYTLGALPPFQTIESCVCMGASIGMAKGAADAGMRPVLAVIGDSTFLHSGVTPLMDAVAHDSPITVIILDNETVGMTGQQPPALPHSRLEPIVLGVGVDPDHCHLVETHPRRVDELADLIRAEMEHPGVSVIIGVRECIEAARKRKAAARREGDGAA